MKCECEGRGFNQTGMRGVLASGPDADGALVIERCDARERFKCDEVAAIYYATIRDRSLRYCSRAMKIEWRPR